MNNYQNEWKTKCYQQDKRMRYDLIIFSFYKGQLSNKDICYTYTIQGKSRCLTDALDQSIWLALDTVTSCFSGVSNQSTSYLPSCLCQTNLWGGKALSQICILTVDCLSTSQGKKTLKKS